MEYREYIEQFKHLGCEDDIFYPDEDPVYGKVFNGFFTFCRDNIDHKMWETLNIKPCYFFFHKSEEYRFDYTGLSENKILRDGHHLFSPFF